MRDLLPSKLTQKSRSLLIQYALFRWENAVVVAGAIVLTALGPLGSLNPIVWPLLGLAGTAAITISSLANPRANAALLLKVFQAQFNPSKLHSPELRQAVARALEYQRRIEEHVRQQHASPLWSKPEDAANQIESWIANIYRLALQLDAYRRDTLLLQQMQTVPAEIERLKGRRERETAPVFQTEVDRVIESKQRQLNAMRALDSQMRQAELLLDQSLAALGTMDSQVKLIDTHDVDGGKSDRLRTDVADQVDRLNDLVESINEVYEIPTSTGGGGLKMD